MVGTGDSTGDSTGDKEQVRGQVAICTTILGINCIVCVPYECNYKCS